MIIGLTGVYCSGKNHIAGFLEKKGLPVIDADKLGYLALEAQKETVFSLFGSDLKSQDGSLNRRLLGQKVFGNPEKLAALENIIHPFVNGKIDEWIAQNNQEKGKICVINAALLHKSTAFSKLSHIILVTSPFLTRLIRAKRRDKLSFKAILKRFTSQKDFNSQYLAVNAEIYRVENSAAARGQKLERRIDKILERIKNYG